jgi:uncharacterized membrane protein
MKSCLSVCLWHTPCSAAVAARVFLYVVTTAGVHVYNEKLSLCLSVCLWHTPCSAAVAARVFLYVVNTAGVHVYNEKLSVCLSVCGTHYVIREKRPEPETVAAVL